MSFLTKVGPLLFLLNVTVLQSRAANLTLPILSFLEDSLSQKITETDEVRTGEKVRFRLALDTTGKYQSIRVESCQFADVATPGEVDGVYVLVLDGSCPVTGQAFFDEDNRWRPHFDKPSQLTTGLVTMAAIGRKGALFLHCYVKMCLKGLSKMCESVACHEEQEKQVEKRGAVSMTSQENVALVVQHISLAADNSGSEIPVGTTMYLLIAVMGFALAAFAGVFVFLYFRSNSRLKKRARRVMRPITTRLRSTSLSSSTRKLTTSMGESKV